MSDQNKYVYRGYVPKQQKKSENKKGIKLCNLKITWRQILIVVCAVVFIICAILLISYAVEAAKTKKLNNLSSDITFNDNDFDTKPVNTAEAVEISATVVATDISANTATEKPQPVVTEIPVITAQSKEVTGSDDPWPKLYPNNSTLRISNAFYTLRSTYDNNDICAYIEIEDVISGQPVVQRDNSFYLTHSVDLKTNQNGTLFIDENCDLKTVPAQIVVYGHNMKDGLAFGPLKKYATKNVSFYKEHPFITFNTIYENSRYVIFSVIEDLDIRSGQPNYLPFWYYSNFTSADQFNDYIIQAKALSKYHCNIDIEPGDRLLVLSTCVGTNEYQKNLRFIVMARRIRDNESEFELQQEIMTATDK